MTSATCLERDPSNTTLKGRGSVLTSVTRRTRTNDDRFLNASLIASAPSALRIERPKRIRRVGGRRSTTSPSESAAK